MSGAASRTERTTVPDALKHWSGLPEEFQARVVARLAPKDAARAAAANKHLDQLVQSSWPWPCLLRKSARRGPLPIEPAHRIETMLKPYEQAGHLGDIIRSVKRCGAPFSEESIFEADLECWTQQEKKRGSASDSDIDEVALEIKESGLSAPELDLSAFSYRTLPHCIGNLSNLRSLVLISCRSLERLPDSMANLSSLEQLCLNSCTRLSTLPDFLIDLPKLKSIGLMACPQFRGKLLPAKFFRPGLVIFRDPGAYRS